VPAFAVPGVRRQITRLITATIGTPIMKRLSMLIFNSFCLSGLISIRVLERASGRPTVASCQFAGLTSATRPPVAHPASKTRDDVATSGTGTRALPSKIGDFPGENMISSFA